MKNILLLIPLMIPGIPALAADSDGKALLDENCTKCHDSGVYTREDRLVGDRAALDGQVRRCAANLELKWFDEDVDAVVDYLDHNYYKFGNAAQ